MIIKVNSNAETDIDSDRVLCIQCLTELKDSMCALTATLDNNFISVDLLIEKTRLKSQHGTFFLLNKDVIYNLN